MNAYFEAFRLGFIPKDMETISMSLSAYKFALLNNFKEEAEATCGIYRGLQKSMSRAPEGWPEVFGTLQLQALFCDVVLSLALDRDGGHRARARASKSLRKHVQMHPNDVDAWVFRARVDCSIALNDTVPQSLSADLLLECISFLDKAVSIPSD